MDPDLGDLTEELALVWQMEKDSQSVPSAHFHFDSGMFLRNKNVKRQKQRPRHYF